MVVVVGETSSGKSALAMALAEQFGGELICADSWTVYKGFDVGTAKPSHAEQTQVRHHLLDIADPAVGFNAVEFQKQAQKAIEDICGRGKLPILVGGTGLYIDSILFGYQFLPAPVIDIRTELNTQTLDELIRRAKEMDLDIAGVDLRNKRRVVRLIENKGVRPTKGEMRPNTLVMGIETDREDLRQRITLRVDAMLTAGLEIEVKKLAQQYGWDAEPMKGIGYREWRDYFEGRNDAAGNVTNDVQTLAQTRERIISASMGLAKRQRTWFKRNDCIHWLQRPNIENKAIEYTTTFLGV